MQPCYGVLTKGLGACRGAAAYPASSPDGVVSSKEGMGRAPTLWDVLHTLHPVVSTPSRLLSLLRYAAHPLRIPSMRYREVLQGIYTLCYSLYGLHAALYTLHHVVYHWYSTKGIAT